jgi:hypothetical protein
MSHTQALVLLVEVGVIAVGTLLRAIGRPG